MKERKKERKLARERLETEDVWHITTTIKPSTTHKKIERRRSNKQHLSPRPSSHPSIHQIHPPVRPTASRSMQYAVRSALPTPSNSRMGMGLAGVVNVLYRI